jgi:hypothetical protein
MVSLVGPSAPDLVRHATLGTLAVKCFDHCELAAA